MDHFNFSKIILIIRERLHLIGQETYHEQVHQNWKKIDRFIYSKLFKEKLNYLLIGQKMFPKLEAKLS